MRLSRLELENYKPFPGREAVDIRPLTVLIGKNNSGKSALVRFPLLLARSMSDQAESPLELQVDRLDFGASFLDVIHNRIPHGAVGLAATFQTDDGGKLRLAARIQNVSEFMLQIVSEFELSGAGFDTVRIRWQERNPLAQPGEYLLDDQPARISFAGLFPSHIETDGVSQDKITNILSQLQTARQAIQAALNPISYLGAFREPAKRTYLFPGGLPQNVGMSGVNAASLLGADFLRRQSTVLDEVGRWYVEHLGWKLGVSRQQDTFSLVLISPHDPSVEINLADTGTGMNQVLALVVQRLFEATTKKRSSIEIVEQPELHLHPAAQVTLGDLYADALSLENPPIFLIETHSEHLLLRLRRRVAEGRLDSNKVVIYWVRDDPGPGSKLVPIYITADGGVTDWPSGVFAEDFAEVKAIRAATRPPP